MKKAYTIEQQIARLKSNGMTFDNEEKAKEILLDVGYYRLGFIIRKTKCSGISEQNVPFLKTKRTSVNLFPSPSTK